MSTIEQQRAIVEQARKQWNARRVFLGVHKLQEKISKRTPARGGVWISQDSCRISRDGTNLPGILQRVILDLSPPTVVHLPPTPAGNMIHFEWIGRQKENVTHEIPTTDKEVFQRLCADADSNVTILYAHAGGFLYDLIQNPPPLL